MNVDDRLFTCGNWRLPIEVGGLVLKINLFSLEECILKIQHDPTINDTTRNSIKICQCDSSGYITKLIPISEAKRLLKLSQV